MCTICFTLPLDTVILCAVLSSTEPSFASQTSGYDTLRARKGNCVRMTPHLELLPPLPLETSGAAPSLEVRHHPPDGVVGPSYRPVVLAVVPLAVLVLAVMAPEANAPDALAVSSIGREPRPTAVLAGLLMLTEGWRCSIPARRAVVGGSPGEEEEVGFGRDRLTCPSEYTDWPAPAKNDRHRHHHAIHSAVWKKGRHSRPPRKGARCEAAHRLGWQDAVLLGSRLTCSAAC